MDNLTELKVLRNNLIKKREQVYERSLDNTICEEIFDSLNDEVDSLAWEIESLNWQIRELEEMRDVG